MSSLGQEPTGTTKDLFGLSGRAAGTGSLLPRRPRDPQQAPADPKPPVAPRRPPASAEAPAPEPAPPNYPQRVVVYVSQNVAARLERYRRQARGRTNTTVLLAALTAAAKSDPAALVTAARITEEGSDLFPAAESQVRYRGGGPVQVQASLTPPQIEVFDRLVAAAGAGDRTKLAAVCLNAFLPGRRD
jgi:hypothetical protein